MNYRQISFVIILSCLVSSIYAQSSSGNVAKKLIDELVGKWQITKINDGNKNVQLSAHPQAMQNIEFTREAKYIVRNNAVKSDSGLFRANENHKVIYLESANDHDHPMEWEATLHGDVLTLSRKETTGEPKTIKYFYARQTSAEHPVKKKENDKR